MHIHTNVISSQSCKDFKSRVDAKSTEKQVQVGGVSQSSVSLKSELSLKTLKKKKAWFHFLENERPF